MNKGLLEEYAQTKEEVRLLEERIKKKEEQLSKLIEQGTVCDMVKGGYGGTQHFKIEGIPSGTLTLLKSNLEHQNFILTCRCNKLIEQETEVEQFIADLPTAELRMITTYKYIEGLDWEGVAKKMGPGRTATSCRLILFRYFKKVFDDYDEIIENDKKFY